MLNTLGLYVFLLVGACPDCQANTSPEYAEDLAGHRTLFPVPIETYTPLQPLKHQSKRNASFTVVHDITSRLQQLLLDLKAYAQLTTTIAGYTIQGYNGTNRQLAFQIKEELCSHLAYLNAEVQYKQPNFTVQIGRFLDRIEAYPLYLRIKKFWPQAIIRPTSFPNKAGIFEFVKTIEIIDNPEVNGIQVIDGDKTVPAQDLPVDTLKDATTCNVKP